MPFGYDVLYPTHATQAVECTAKNTALIMGSINTATKGASLLSSVALTGAALVDTLYAKNTAAKCLFALSFITGAAGSASSGASVLNDAVGLPLIGVAAECISAGCYIAARRAAYLGRIADGNITSIVNPTNITEVANNVIDF